MRYLKIVKLRKQKIEWWLPGGGGGEHRELFSG